MASLPVLAVGGLILLVSAGFSQTPAQPAAARPEFEVASIKPDKSSNMFVMVRPEPGGRFTATNIPIRFLITVAYKIKDFQLTGAPPWVMSDRYDIEAKAEGNPSIDEMRPMLQTLLEDRLHLKFHRETKEEQVYALVVAKPGKLPEAQGECGPRPDKLPPLEPGKMPSAPCGGFMMFPGHAAAQKATIPQFVDAISRLVNRIVIDKTGLTGKYDITLDWTPEQGQFQGPTGGAPPPPGLPPLPQPDPNGPSLFTAVQEQLGLKLESQKAPVEMFVIDHVERPSEN